MEMKDRIILFILVGFLLFNDISTYVGMLFNAKSISLE